MIAGTTGEARRIEAIEFIDLPEGIEIDFHAHVQDKGDLAFDNIKKGRRVICGTTGQGLRLEAFNIHVLENKTGKQLRYQGHIQDQG